VDIIRSLSVPSHGIFLDCDFTSLLRWADSYSSGKKCKSLERCVWSSLYACKVWNPEFGGQRFLPINEIQL